MKILKFLLLLFILLLGFDFFGYFYVYSLYCFYLLDIPLPLFIYTPSYYFLEYIHEQKIYNIVIADVFIRASIISYISYCLIKYIKGGKIENKT